ncbi:hypothetical protein [Sorangium sp. So ce1078]
MPHIVERTEETIAMSEEQHLLAVVQLRRVGFEARCRYLDELRSDVR